MVLAFFTDATAQARPEFAGIEIINAPVEEQRDPNLWVEEFSSIGLGPERVLARFAIDPGQNTPQYLTAQRSSFRTIHISAISVDGSRTTVSRDFSEVEPVAGGGLFVVPLPQTAQPPSTILVAIDFLADVRVARSLALTDQDPRADPATSTLQLWIAMTAGMLIIPLVFGIAIFRVLRQQFVVWHTLTAFSLLLTVLANSAVLTRFIDINNEQLVRLCMILPGLSVASVLMFGATFIGQDKISPWMHKAVRITALFSLGLGLAMAAFPFFGRGWFFQAYFVGFVPAMVLLLWMVVAAIKRGSHYGWYALIGIAPLYLVGIARMFGQFLPDGPDGDFMILFYFGCVIEEIVAMLGVADRMFRIRRDRDIALSNAEAFDELSRIDPLTGLANRRTLEADLERIESAAGLAIIDLDHFKRINDTYGHMTGDRALQAVARILEREFGHDAIRLGGEEFLVCLKDSAAVKRAEKARRAITGEVRKSLKEIEWRVTASMGVVLAERLQQGQSRDFKSLYALADKALYSAKDAGRDRMVEVEPDDYEGLPLAV